FPRCACTDSSLVVVPGETSGRIGGVAPDGLSGSSFPNSAMLIPCLWWITAARLYHPHARLSKLYGPCRASDADVARGSCATAQSVDQPVELGERVVLDLDAPRPIAPRVQADAGAEAVSQPPFHVGTLGVRRPRRAALRQLLGRAHRQSPRQDLTRQAQLGGIARHAA